MDIALIRTDTPGCDHKLFLDSAGSSLMPRGVVDEIIQYLREEEQIGGYEQARQRGPSIQSFYEETAKLLHAKPQNIAFTYNATDGYARALSSIPFQRGQTILTSNDDYASNQIAFLSLQKRFGIKIIHGKNLDNGDLDLEDFERQLKNIQPVLVALTHIPTNSGLIQPVESVGALCQKYHTWYLVDACQSVGQMDVDVTKIQCDFLTATGRKFLRGPRGTGFLYLSDRVIREGLEPLVLDMRGAEWTGYNEYRAEMNAKRFEIWEFSYASLIGLTAAIRYANKLGLGQIEVTNRGLVTLLRQQLESLDSVRVLDRGSRKGSILTFDMPQTSFTQLEKTLRKNHVYFSVSTKSAAYIDFTTKNVDQVIRFSPHYFNTPAEIGAVTEIIDSIRLT